MKAAPTCSCAIHEWQMFDLTQHTNRGTTHILIPTDGVPSDVERTLQTLVTQPGSLAVCVPVQVWLTRPGPTK